MVVVFILSQADKTAPAPGFIALEYATEHATLKGYMGTVSTHLADKAAIEAFSVSDITADADVAVAVSDNVFGTSSPYNKAAVIPARTVDAAVDDEVANGCILDAIERGHRFVDVILRTAVCNRQRVSTTVEDASEGEFVMIVRNEGAVDVGSHGHRLAGIQFFHDARAFSGYAGSYDKILSPF
jgi:hypothetical protein